jgi:hypothetical protein
MRVPFRSISALLFVYGLTGLSGAPTLAAAGVGPPWPEYQGAWFSIEYPPGFRPRPSQPSSSSDGYDSAFFKSPDGAVEFYVYSPQWSGDATDIAVDPAREKVVSEKTTHGKSGQATWRTIAARDRSYTRSLVDTHNALDGTRLVFGIKYRDQRAYDAHKSDYLRFKRSLAQHAD